MNRTPSPQPGGCPDAAELASFFEGRLSGGQRATVVAHLADCAECRAAVGALGRLNASEPPAVPASLLDTATGRPPRSRSHRRSVAVVVTAAACVLLAVSVARRSPQHPGDAISTPGVVQSQPTDDVRAKTAGAAPQLMEPRPGATLSTPTRFDWTPVAGAVQYQLHVLTGDGDIVFDATTAETTIDFGGEDVQQGPLYAWVSAQLTDGRRVQSAVVRLAGPSR